MDMSKSERDLSWALNILSILACLLLLACEEKQEAAKIVRPVETMTVRDVEGFVQRYFPGRSSATQEPNAAFRVSGQLLKRPIKVGEEIGKGDLIAALDPSTFQAEVDRSSAEVSSSKAAAVKSGRGTKYSRA